jgi:membrane protease YdiL (CAAX protease family)
MSTSESEPANGVDRAGFPSRGALLFWGVVIESALALVALLLGWLLDVPVLGQLTWDWTDALIGVLATVPLLGAFVAADLLPFGALRRVREITDELLRPFLAPCKVPDMLLFSVLAGVCEELLFRGFMQPWLSGWLGPVGGLVLASVLFGAAHALTVTYAVVATLIGCYVGWLFLLTDNLLVVVVAHALYDFVAMLYVRYGPQPRRPGVPIE